MLLVAVLTAGCDMGAPARVEVPPDSAAGEVGFQLAGPNEAALIVPVYLNGQGPFDFVLDTGATFTCVDQPIAEQLGLPPRRGVLALGAGVGGAGRIQIVGVDSLRVGSAHAVDLSACVLDLQQIGAVGVEVDGLLGLNFLKSFRVTLDFGRNVVLLREP